MKRVKFFLCKSAIEKQLDAEVGFHLESLVQEKLASGLSPEEARRQTLIDFGGAEQVKEECREVHRLPLLENASANLKSALRFMRRSPGFSIAVILTLALGIGANSAVFSALDAILLRPLPYPNASELVVLHQYNRSERNARRPIAPVRLEEWNRYNSTLQALAGAYTQDVSETSGTFPERLTEADVTPRFLQVLGISPVLGRHFAPAEEHFGGPRAVLISDRLWRRRFQADPNVLGKTLRIESRSVPIIGVLPATVQFPDTHVDVWLAVPMDAPIAQNRAFTWFTGIGRMRSGISLAKCLSDLNAVQTRLAREFPKTDRDLAVEIEPLKETIVAGVRRSLWIVFGSVTLLLLIACTNIAALLLSRITQRTHEISIRYSLGASRGSIIAQLLTEAFLLAITGSVLGLAVAAAGVRVFHSLAKTLPRTGEITLDWRLAVYTLCSAVLATLLCGLIPALVASRRSISSTLASGSRTQVSARASLQLGLVSVQVALAVTLLVGAGLLLRSFQHLGRVSPGFDPDHVLTLRLSGNYGETGDQQKMFEYMKRVLDGIASVPGVESAAMSATVPGAARGFPMEIKITDASLPPNRKIIADEKVIYGNYFATLRIPLLAGTACKEDTLWTTAVVNRSFVETYFPNQPAIGHQLEITPFDSKPRIIGIIPDIRENGLNDEPVPTFYWCSTNASPSPYFLVRTPADPMNFANNVTRKINQLEPRRSVFDIIPLSEHLSEYNAENRFRTLLLTLFALTAISLACIGLYATLSYLIAQRRQEIGLRMALGALPGQIFTLFLLQGTLVSLAGCLAGLAIATVFSRLLVSMLYGVSRLDGVTYLCIGIGALTLAAAASAIPATRASRFDPMHVLREE
jgi:putative ABC transport system permease protein